MAVLTGFPASNTITIGTQFPKIVKKKAVITDLKYGDRFIHRDSEYYLLPEKDHFGRPSPTAICYKSSNEYDLGRLAMFVKATEVVHLFEDWTWKMEDEPGL